MTFDLPLSPGYLVFTIESVLHGSLGAAQQVLAHRENTVVKQELAQLSTLITPLVQKGFEGGLECFACLFGHQLGRHVLVSLLQADRDGVGVKVNGRNVL